MTPFNKIINSIKNNRQDITVLDIGSLTDDEIDEINKCYADALLFYRDPLKKSKIAISRFMMEYMKPDEYVYKVYAVHDPIYNFLLKKEKVMNILNNHDVAYVKRLNKFEKWLSDEQ